MQETVPIQNDDRIITNAPERTVIVWNHLDGDIISAPAVHSFEDRFKKHQHIRPLS